MLAVVVAALSLCAKRDPFRPARPPLEPIVINAVQDLLKTAAPASEVASRALEARSNDPDYDLTPDEQKLVMRRIAAVAMAREPLMTLLSCATERTPWVRHTKPHKLLSPLSALHSLLGHSARRLCSRRSLAHGAAWSAQSRRPTRARPAGEKVRPGSRLWDGRSL